MTIRRLDQAGKTYAPVGKAKAGKAGDGAGGEIFTRVMDSLAGVGETAAAQALNGVGGVGDEPSPRQRREQLERTGRLLDTLESLEQDLVRPDEAGDGLSEASLDQLRETRDQALRTLSDTPNRGAEHDLLHRTAVLATVELAKTDRGDYK
ncbi:MAG: hypothetical protein HQL82_11665 [Magnetococcales bacterium]|nr:hypothetical protein [Magnetococcales bacterium]